MARPPQDHPAVEALNEATCRALISGACFARAVLSIDCLPEAIPAAVAFGEDLAVLASPVGSLWYAGSRHDVVSVQVDGGDPASSWSVQVTGIAGLVEDGREPPGIDAEWLARARERGEHLVSVPLEHVRGHRIVWLASSGAGAPAAK